MATLLHSGADRGHPSFLNLLNEEPVGAPATA
jgi:hypothetical protein